MATKFAKCIKTQLEAYNCCYKSHNLARRDLHHKLELYWITLAPIGNSDPEFDNKLSVFKKYIENFVEDKIRRESTSAHSMVRCQKDCQQPLEE